MSLEILDPTHEGDTREFALAPRLATLAGASIAIISNGKQGTRRFFDAFEAQLLASGAGRVLRLTKANYSAPAEESIFAQARSCDAVIAGIGD
jgi:hypothetical protein